MNTVITLLVGIAIGMVLVVLLRRNSVVQPGGALQQTRGSAGPVVTPSGAATVMVMSGTGNKITDIKAFRACVHLGLAEAKDIADNLPAKLIAGVSTEYAQGMVKQLEAAGLTARVIEATS